MLTYQITQQKLLLLKAPSNLYMSRQEDRLDFMGTSLEVMSVVKPLVAAPPECLENCEKLYNEWVEAFHESAKRGGGVQVVHCNRQLTCSVSGECGVMTSLVGHVRDGKFVPFVDPLIDNPNAQSIFDLLVAELTDGAERTIEIDVSQLVDDSSKVIESLASAITNFGIASQYP